MDYTSAWIGIALCVLVIAACRRGVVAEREQEPFLPMPHFQWPTTQLLLPAPRADDEDGETTSSEARARARRAKARRQRSIHKHSRRSFDVWLWISFGFGLLAVIGSAIWVANTLFA